MHLFVDCPFFGPGARAGKAAPPGARAGEAAPNAAYGGKSRRAGRPRWRPLIRAGRPVPRCTAATKKTAPASVHDAGAHVRVCRGRPDTQNPDGVCRGLVHDIGIIGDARNNVGVETLLSADGNAARICTALLPQHKVYSMYMMIS